jgi:hypothetical protein
MTLSSAASPVAAAVTLVATLVVASVSPALAQTNHLTIRMYDYSAVDRRVRTGAVDEARAIVDDAGVTADWHDCSRSELCAPEAGDLVIRVVRETGSSELEWRRALGYSVVDPGAGTGMLATIYINRVEDAARHAGADVALLLGRAVAHEVGHLILHTNEHGNHGLMRAIWTEDEMFRNTHDDWVFASPERTQIHSALQRTGRSAAR